MKKKDLTQGKYIPLYSSETIFPDFITYILNLTPDQLDKPLLMRPSKSTGMLYNLINCGIIKNIEF